MSAWSVFLFGLRLTAISYLLGATGHLAYRAASTATPWRAVLAEQPRLRAWIGLALAVVAFSSAGMASTIWEGVAWGLIGAATVPLVLSGFRHRLPGLAQSRLTLRTWLSGPNGIATMLILLAVLLAALYALIILPWMQPDEPRHFEVALHVARLGQPVVTSNDRVPEWEQEMIASMEALSFWWYGFSFIGWDPNNLPKSFREIWGPAYSTAFFQPPLYYTVTGGLIALWGQKWPIETGVLVVRLFGLALLALSLAGTYKTIAELFPDRPHWALGVLGFAALWPSHLAANAAVNNDLLAEALVIWVMYFAVSLLRRGFEPGRMAWLLALTIFAITTKRTALTAAVVTPLALLFSLMAVERWRRRPLAVAGGVAVVLLVVLGLGAVLMQAGRLGLPKTFLADLMGGVYWRNLLTFPYLEHGRAIFRTFVGWFGWMRVPLLEPFYWLGGLLLILALLGLVRLLLRKRRRPLLTRWQKQGLFLFVVAILAQTLFVIGKQLLYADFASDSIPQARYFYPIAPALFFFLWVGLTAWLPPHRRGQGLFVGVALLLLFNVYVLGFVLYPFFWL
ncbi:MAG: DUF2142 domain-containing protein, partial [Caldilineales bacterium]|nr:DUF2142 domain-containing protein [Caldilineales bacterium]MCX7852526.1 DUF2142 domain-containing protein [Caldilineales bacterium]